MHTPIAALAWEFWRRHRIRIVIIAGLFLGFALVYPILCAQADFNPNSKDALNEMGRKYLAVKSGNELLPLEIFQMFYFLFLVGGPITTMALTLACVAWMCTFTEFDPKTKTFLKFPARLFTLPVSTSFLFWSLFLGGMAAIIVLYESWVHFVPLPHIEGFEGIAGYQNCFAWMTLLALIQGIVWALASWPKTRALLCVATIYVFILPPVQQALSELPYLAQLILLLPLFLLGLALGRAGLQKMRHSQWQGWAWKWPLAAGPARMEMRGPKRFASPAQAQLWFEWRRFARSACFYVAALVVGPISIHLVWRLVDGLGPLDRYTAFAFFLYVLAVPLLVHCCFGMSHAKSDMPFVMMRPLANGEMMMATLKAAGISTAFSWGVVVAAFCAMPLLGKMPPLDSLSIENVGVRDLVHSPTIIMLGLILLTWRFVAVNLGFVLSGKRWVAGLPALQVMMPYLVGLMLFIFPDHVEFWNLFWRLVPVLLLCLVALKFLLAFAAFRISLKRGLLAPSALRAYLVVWSLMAAALLIPTLILFQGQTWVLPMALVIVLLTPLARIGFCPIALDWNRHA